MTFSGVMSSSTASSSGVVGLAAQVLEQLALRAGQLVDDLDHVHRDADRTGLVGHGPGGGLPDPPGGVRGELVTLRLRHPDFPVMPSCPVLHLRLHGLTVNTLHALHRASAPAPQSARCWTITRRARWTRSPASAPARAIDITFASSQPGCQAARHDLTAGARRCRDDRPIDKNCRHPAIALAVA